MYFIQKFDELKMKLETANLIAFAKEANEAANEFKKFNLHIMRKQLEGNIVIHFTPTFLNHMVKEVEEYITVLKYLMEGKVPPSFSLITLLEEAGHAGAISSKAKSDEDEKHFEQFCNYSAYS